MTKLEVTIGGKDPDILAAADSRQARSMKKFLEFGEYYRLALDVDPVSGKCSGRFIRVRDW